MTTITIKHDVRLGKYTATYKGKTIKSPNLAYMKIRAKAIANGEALEFVVNDGTKQSKQAKALDKMLDKFDINKRFEFVEQIVQMVANKKQPSVMITGEGGLGKTYTVVKVLKDAGLEDYSLLDGLVEGAVLSKKRFVTIKGYSTAKGLFRFLYDNNDAVIIFDDCDSVLKDKDALNILKGALDSYERRIITWNSDSKDEDLPKAFEFTGNVVFISNINLEDMDQAVKSRSMCVDLSMTVDQKIERMEHIVGSSEFLPKISLSLKKEALEFLRKKKTVAKEISLRTLISVSKIREAHPHNWEDLSTYMLCH